MNERYSEEVKAILEAAQQQAVMNYHQELTTAHILAALCGSDGFFKYLLQSLHIDEDAFSRDAKALVTWATPQQRVFASAVMLPLAKTSSMASIL